MDWLRAKARGPHTAAAAQQAQEPRPASSGSARDVADVSVDGVGGGKAAAPRADEVHVLASSPEDKGSEKKSVELQAAGIRTSGLAEMSRTEPAGRLFDTIDQSGDGSLSKDELTPALQVLPARLAISCAMCLTMHPTTGYRLQQGQSRRDL